MENIQSISEVDLTIHRIELPTPFPVGPVNAFLLITQSQRVLVDCGPKSPEAESILLSSLRQFDVLPHELTGLVLTHGHVDHVGLTARLQAEGVPVYAHQDVHTWLEPGGPWDQYREAFFHRLYAIMGVPNDVRGQAIDSLFLLNRWNDRSVVTYELSSGTPFPLIPQFQVVHVPGHAQAAIALWDPKSGVLLCGDQILPDISSNALIEPVLTAAHGEEADRTLSLLDYRNDLERWMHRKVTMVHPGHGPSFEGAHALIRERLADQVKRAAAFEGLVRAQPKSSAWELACSFFPQHRNQVSLILSETVGYLDWLNEDGRVTRESDENGILRWSL